MVARLAMTRVPHSLVPREIRYTALRQEPLVDFSGFVARGKPTAHPRRWLGWR
ncbi:hypothetical protein HPTD01_2482 [Halomonas sp. TD01]|nr:hypothetical protein HPTD01_2482 [Halomonas sp. TD01]